MPSSKPSLTELRAVCQPESVIGRVSAEHWAGRLYMRKVSLHLTRQLVNTRVTPDAVTWWMIVSGWFAAAALVLPGVWPAVLAFLLIQAQLLFDCSDGEIARWRRQTGAKGVYLDRIGHYTTESALIAALGVRADGGVTSVAGWTSLCLVGAVLVLISKAETDLVHVARAYAKLPLVDDEAAKPRGRIGGIRRLVSYFPFHRAIGAPELTLLAVLAAAGDAVTGTVTVTQGLAGALVAIAAIVVGGHLLSILASNRLR
jgi:hypothetical protein